MSYIVSLWIWNQTIWNQFYNPSYKRKARILSIIDWYKVNKWCDLFIGVRPSVYPRASIPTPTTKSVVYFLSKQNLLNLSEYIAWIEKLLKDSIQFNNTNRFHLIKCNADVESKYVSVSPSTFIDKHLSTELP